MFPIFDAHADTISKIYETNQSINKNTCHIDYSRMQRYSKYTQVFSAFVDKKAIWGSPKKYVEKLILKYKDESACCNLVNICKSEDVDKGNYSAILAIEGGEALEGKLDNLYYFYRHGVRVLTLTWNYDNELSGGIGDFSGDGLTDFGRKVVKHMNELGMIVDVSHLSENGFWDVAKICRKPFIASHSNVKKICTHKRNLSDEQLKEIINLNGVIGINFYPEFLSETEECDIEKILEHIEYIIKLGGENNVGIGSDFDGIDKLPKGIYGAENFETLIELMKKRNYGDDLIRKILYKNFMRIVSENLR